jgi:hypothetical protein
MQLKPGNLRIGQQSPLNLKDAIYNRYMPIAIPLTEPYVAALYRTALIRLGYPKRQILLCS